ncbi:MAG: HipA protein [Lachnospiraceae bacterium]|nr:HipA protein [Lachnospiraceae bacterium]
MENKYGGIELYETEREADAVLPVNYTELEPWLSQRQAPKHRAHIEKLLRQCGCYNLDGFVRLTHALSLNDTFWVKSRQSDLNWNDVSLYRNEFDETIARLAFEGGLYGDYFSTTSPEFGTSGSFAKCWVREQDGIYLMKCGSEGFANAGLEPYSEMYASEIASAICHKSVPYTTQMYRGKLVSSCPLFTDEENGFVAMIHFRKTTQPGELLRFMEKYEAEDDFRRMLVLDALILNVDRHPGNYGMIFDTDTMEIKGMAPVFDHNMSLLPYAMQEDFDNLDEYLSSRPARIGIDFNEVANSMLTPDIRADLRNLYGFRFSRNYAYALPEDRLRILESVVNSQINRILKRIPLYIPPADDTGIFKIDR